MGALDTLQSNGALLRHTLFPPPPGLQRACPARPHCSSAWESNSRMRRARATLGIKPLSQRDGFDEVPRDQRARERKGPSGHHQCHLVPRGSSRSSPAALLATSFASSANNRGPPGFPIGPLLSLRAFSG